MQWKNQSFLITALLSFAYTLVAFLNLIGTIHPRIETLQGPIIHPKFCFIYWISALCISWLIYFIFRGKKGRFSFFITILVGLILIFSGVFLWKIAIHYDDVLVLLNAK